MANEFIIKNGFHSKGDSQITGSLNVKDSLTVNGSAVGAAFPFSGDAQITGSLDVSGSITTFDINMSTWTLGADGGSNYYYFTGPGDLGGTEQNPDIHLTRGQKYRFYNPMDAHPFQIQDLGGSAFGTGVTNNGVQLGFLSFDVPMDGPTHLKYQCTSHAAMVGNIYIADARVASGSLSGSFQGDGTNLDLASNTTIPASNPFPISASSAQIISRSFASGHTDSTSLRLLGSGSVSESGIFEVKGSVGPLFSVADGLDGILMEVNDISGLPLLQVSSSGIVRTPVGITSQRPIVTFGTNFTASSAYEGYYFRVGGEITCSIQADALPTVNAEFDFFQTSSAGNLLFETGSTSVIVNSKNGNLNLAGQFSSATLKYIGNNTFDLMGDLT